jgi:hypothetical protein
MHHGNARHRTHHRYDPARNRQKLAEQAKPNAGNKGGQRYVPDLIAELAPEMELRGGFRAAGADESKVDRLRRELAKARAQLEALGGYGYRLSGEPGRRRPGLAAGFQVRCSPAGGTA